MHVERSTQLGAASAAEYCATPYEFPELLPRSVTLRSSAKRLGAAKAVDIAQVPDILATVVIRVRE